MIAVIFLDRKYIRRDVALQIKKKRMELER